MADDHPEEEEAKRIFGELFGGDESPEEQLRRHNRRLERRISELEGALGKVRAEGSETRHRVTALRNATVDLLSPISLAGASAIIFAFTRARGFWDYMLISGFALFALFWLREMFRDFDEVTKQP